MKVKGNITIKGIQYKEGFNELQAEEIKIDGEFEFPIDKLKLEDLYRILPQIIKKNVAE